MFLKDEKKAWQKEIYNVLLNIINYYLLKRLRKKHRFKSFFYYYLNH